jgi:hypothetical protein
MEKKSSTPAPVVQTTGAQSASIFPALAGPLGIATLSGASTIPFSWTTTHLFSKKIFVGIKWVKIHHKWVPIKQYKTVNYSKNVKHTSSSKSKLNTGKAVVGCVMGSALGAISASIRKATAMGNPPRWRSQAEHEAIVASGYEKQFELTSDEAATALATCGLGSFALHWEQQAPQSAVVRASN